MKLQMLKPTDPLLIELQEAEKKLNDLNLRKSSLNHEIDARCERLLALDATTQSQDRLEMEAEAMLQGSAVSGSAIRKDIEALRHEMEVVERAITIQAGLVDSARGRMSIALCELNRPGYIAIEKRIAAAVAELARANAEEISLFRQLLDAGCRSITFRPMRLGLVGTLDDGQSIASIHRREVAEFCPEALQ
jgi:hypothetical protein